MKSYNQKRKVKRKISGKGRGRSLGAVTIRGHGYPVYVAQTTSGTGALLNQESLASLSYVDQLYLDPFHIGGRLAEIASMYDEWRVRYMKFTYHPLVSVTGSNSTSNGTPSTAGLVTRNVIMNAWEDPFGIQGGFTNASKTDLHIIRRTEERFELDVSRLTRKAGWKYTTCSLASPTIPDLRQVCAGMLGFSFQSASSGSAFTYGTIHVDWICDFRSPVYTLTPVAMKLEYPLGSGSYISHPAPPKQDNGKELEARRVLLEARFGFTVHSLEQKDFAQSSPPSPVMVGSSDTVMVTAVHSHPAGRVTTPVLSVSTASKRLHKS